MPVALPADPSLRPRARRPRSACHPAVRSTAESRRPADQEFLRRNSSNRTTPPIPQRWPTGHRPLATACWRLPARPTPSAPPPRPKPPARVVSPGSPPPSRPNMAPAFPVRDSRCSTRRTHYSHEARAARKSKPPEKQLRASPARRIPRPGSPPLATVNRRPAPTRPFYAQRTVPSPDGPKSPEPALDLSLRTTPPNSGRPAAPRARTPARRLTPQPGPKPPPRRRNPSQSVPQMISTAKPIVLITRTNDWRPVSRGALRRCFSLHHPAAALSRQPTAGTRRLPARLAPCGRTPSPDGPKSPAPLPCASQTALLQPTLDLSCARPRRTLVGPRRPAPTPPRHASPHSPAKAPRQPSGRYPPNDQAC